MKKKSLRWYGQPVRNTSILFETLWLYYWFARSSQNEMMDDTKNLNICLKCYSENIF